MRGRIWKHLGWSLLWVMATVGGADAQWVVAHTEPTKADLNGILFYEDRFGWMIGNKGILQFSQDGGIAWDPLGSGLGEVNLKEIFFHNREEGWVVVSGGRLLKTTNGGETWTESYRLTQPQQGFNSLTKKGLGRRHQWAHRRDDRWRAQWEGAAERSHR